MVFLSRFTSRFWEPIIALWIVAAALLFIFAPSLSEVGVTDQTQFLPQGTESAAAALLEGKFQRLTPPPAGEALLVVYNQEGLSEADMQNAREVHDWLLSDSGPEHIEKVVSVFESEALRPVLVSADSTAMVMKLDLSVGDLSDDAGVLIDDVRSHVQESCPGTTMYLSGKSGLYQDMFQSVQQTVDRTTIVTIVLVAILLLLVYRSPVAILLPLFAIGCSYLVSAGLVGFLGQAGVKFSTLTSAYLVVIVFGVGTDYCLFIVSRYREELHAREYAEAQSEALGHIAPVIAASALTVMVALLSLGISRLGINQTSGYALAIGVAVTLLAALTLVPALMSAFGRHLFWPTNVKAPPRERRFGWRTIGRSVSARPFLMALPIVLLLLVPYAALPGLDASVDMIDQLPRGADSVKGYRALSERFNMGELYPSYVLVEAGDRNLTSAASRQALGELAQEIAGVEGVTRVVGYAAPAPELSALAEQLRTLSRALAAGGGLDQLGSLQDAGGLLQGLPLQYPGVLQSTNFLQAAGGVARGSALAGQVPATPPAGLAMLRYQLQDAVNTIAGGLDGLAAEFRLEASTPFTTYLAASYFSRDRTIARMEFVVDGDTNAPAALDTIGRVRGTLDRSIGASGLDGAAYYVGGSAAQHADIKLTNESDFGKVMVLSVCGILLVIMVLLRSILAPLYMVLTVLLSYGCTMGISVWLFLDVLRHSSIIYLMPLFVFVILVALGADYNIFLVSRIREEARKRPLPEAVSEAVANTGGIITACGIILAGTFATLTISPLLPAVQVGAAVAIGIMIDTFLVRAILVPALARIFGRWNWWPSPLGRRQNGQGAAVGPEGRRPS